MRPPIPAPDEHRPSKTQRKADSHALQALGEALATLPEERIATLALPEALRDALHEWRRTRSHEGRRRQMQYIGKLMRGTDPEPIRAAVAAARLGPARDALALHEAERWRAELIADDEALTRLAAAHPVADMPALRTLIRQARAGAAERPEERSGRAYRELFRHLRELLDHD
jgi:ribosome-associated protein